MAKWLDTSEILDHCGSQPRRPTGAAENVDKTGKLSTGPPLQAWVNGCASVPL